MHHFDVPELGRAVHMPPTLIVHDRADRSIPVADGIAIAEAWPTARLHVTSGLGHRRLLREPEVVGAVVDFIDGKEPKLGGHPRPVHRPASTVYPRCRRRGSMEGGVVRVRVWVRDDSGDRRLDEPAS
jgi:hypothetical protein